MSDLFDEPHRGITREHWQGQKWRASQRGVAFRFTFDEWAAWWRAELDKLGGGAIRGRRIGKYVMCRFGDQGAYEPGNVYCATHDDNVRHADRANAKARLIEWHATNDCWLLGRTGAAHPRSRAIATPAGTFPSVQAAADHYGVSRTQVRRWLAGEHPWPGR